MVMALDSAASPLSAIVPGEVDGYRPEGDDGIYNRDTLFELINGGAEVYRSLNVKKVLSRRYTKKDGPEILVDIFDMGSASDAYGAYHHDMREGKSAGVGQESELGGSSVFFWKDRYFVSVVALVATPASGKAVVAVARAVAARIKRSGKPPELVGLLPRRDLVGSQVHYFHTWRLLNRHYNFAAEDLLELGSDREGVLARYRHGDKESSARLPALLIVRYPSAKLAEKARKRFMAGFLPGVEAELSRTAARCWVGLWRRGDLIIGVFDAASSAQASAILAGVDRRRKARKGRK